MNESKESQSSSSNVDYTYLTLSNFGVSSSALLSALPTSTAYPRLLDPVPDHEVTICDSSNQRPISCFRYNELKALPNCVLDLKEMENDSANTHLPFTKELTIRTHASGVPILTSFAFGGDGAINRFREAVLERSKRSKVNNKRKKLNEERFGKAPQEEYEAETEEEHDEDKLYRAPSFELSTFSNLPSAPKKTASQHKKDNESIAGHIGSFEWTNAFEGYSTFRFGSAGVNASPADLHNLYVKYVLNGELDPYFPNGIFGKDCNSLSYLLDILKAPYVETRRSKFNVVLEFNKHTCDLIVRYIFTICFQYHLIINERFMEAEGSPTKPFRDSMNPWIFLIYPNWDGRELGCLYNGTTDMPLCNYANRNFLSQFFATVMFQLLPKIAAYCCIDSLTAPSSSLFHYDMAKIEQFNQFRCTQPDNYFNTSRYWQCLVKDYNMMISKSLQQLIGQGEALKIQGNLPFIHTKRTKLFVSCGHNTLTLQEYETTGNSLYLFQNFVPLVYTHNFFSPVDPIFQRRSITPAMKREGGFSAAYDFKHLCNNMSRFIQQVFISHMKREIFNMPVVSYYKDPAPLLYFQLDDIKRWSRRPYSFLEHKNNLFVDTDAITFKTCKDYGLPQHNPFYITLPAFRDMLTNGRLIGEKDKDHMNVIYSFELLPTSPDWQFLGEKKLGSATCYWYLRNNWLWKDYEKNRSQGLSIYHHHYQSISWYIDFITSFYELVDQLKNDQLFPMVRSSFSLYRMLLSLTVIIGSERHAMCSTLHYFFGISAFPSFALNTENCLQFLQALRVSYEVYLRESYNLMDYFHDKYLSPQLLTDIFRFHIRNYDWAPNLSIMKLFFSEEIILKLFPNPEYRFRAYWALEADQDEASYSTLITDRPESAVTELSAVLFGWFCTFLCSGSDQFKIPSNMRPFTLRVNGDPSMRTMDEFATFILTHPNFINYCHMLSRILHLLCPERCVPIFEGKDWLKACSSASFQVGIRRSANEFIKSAFKPFNYSLVDALYLYLSQDHSVSAASVLDPISLYSFEFMLTLMRNSVSPLVSDTPLYRQIQLRLENICEYKYGRCRLSRSLDDKERTLYQKSKRLLPLISIEGFTIDVVLKLVDLIIQTLPFSLTSSELSLTFVCLIDEMIHDHPLLKEHHKRFMERAKTRTDEFHRECCKVWDKPYEELGPELDQAFLSNEPLDCAELPVPSAAHINLNYNPNLMSELDDQLFR